MSKEEALDKIKKLLRMKRGGTKAEVETALAMAQQIAARHGIDLDSVDLDSDEHEPLGHEEIKHGARLQCECEYALLICGRFFGVETFSRAGYRSRSVVFVGTDWDRAIAIYVYRFLAGHLRREWNRRAGRIRNRRSFMYGMYQGLWVKLAEQEAPQVQEPGLVAVDRRLQRRKDYIKENFGGLTSHSVVPGSDASKSRHAGYLAGRATEIRKGVNGAPVPEERQIEKARLRLPAPRPQQAELF